MDPLGDDPHSGDPSSDHPLSDRPSSDSRSSQAACQGSAGAATLRAEDSAYLQRALELAALGRLAVSPNPMVGAVVVKDGQVVGEGWHRRVGGPHAEVEAFRDAAEDTHGATLYVSLEPCNHHGRTPPCSQATIEAGIARVVACHADPDPRVAGEGFERLRRAGIQVEQGFLIPQAARLNWRFLVAAIQKRPAVTLKWAMSLDGRIATREGDSQWISGAAGRRWALEQRECHDAILVGSGTALADDPRLNRRLGEAPGNNTRVVLDRRLRLPPGARMFEVEGPILVYARPASADPGAFDARRRALQAAGATVVALDEPTPARVLEDLYDRGIRSLLVEGGGGITGAFLEAGIYDRVAVCCAPLLVGGDEAPGPIGGLGFAPLSAAPRLGPLEAESRNHDLILSTFEKTCLPALCESLAG